MACTQAYTFDALSQFVRGLNRTKSLRRIAREDFGGHVTHGVIQRILADEEPQDPAIRRALGLSVLIPTEPCLHCGTVHTLGDICPQVTPVRITAYQVRPEELANIPQPVVVVRRRGATAKSRRRIRVELPADITLEQRAAINRLTPAERLNALIEASKQK